jgi:mRNA interferase RelE/StbE
VIGAMYRIEFVSSAAKEFRSLSAELQRRVAASIDKLCQNPRPSGVRKLVGSESLYRVRMGHYRVVYEIDDQEQIIRVTRVRHRGDLYR